MVSRSFRANTSTLKVLEDYAESRDIGITVCIRMVLESFVENLLEDIK